jgi:Zn-dependent protease
MASLVTIFSIIILILSVMFHELAHGTVADRLGDPTPRLSGRLTLNPVAHMELFGSFLLPVMCVLSGSGFIIGWAKPVPFNPNHLKYPRWGPAMVAAAGPLVNFIIAIACAAGYRILISNNPLSAFAGMLSMIVMINISLGVFNLIPMPPLDGHHIIGAVFPKFKQWSDSLMDRYRFVIMIIILFAFSSVLAPIVLSLTKLLLIS